MNSTYSANVTSDSYPLWLPAEFRLTSSTHCPAADSVLKHLGLYNGISILSFLLQRNEHAQNILSCNKSQGGHKLWRWFSPAGRLAFQIAGQVATAHLARGGNASIDAWKVIQLWALRPRTTWFVGNLAYVKREWGWMNAALSSIFVEVFICSLACVFAGRIIEAAVANSPAPGDDKTRYHMILVAAFIMLVSTGMEVMWALYVLVRVMQVGGRAEVDDMDSLRWIARTFVPLTSICSWLIWAAYLKAGDGKYYCPANRK